MRAPLLLGIDGGGTASRAMVRDADHRVVFTGSGGPLNATSVDPAAWRVEVDALLRGCPRPTAAAVCLAGMRSARSRAPVAAHLRRRFGTATRLRLEPDFRAALARFTPPVTACVIAGTGSVVAGLDGRGEAQTTGGEGGRRDRGSAYRLGSLVAARDGSWPGSGTPADVASRAPELTEAAAAGDPWARTVLARELDALAHVTATHLATFHADEDRPTIGIVGGVFTSRVASDAFVASLRARCAHAVVRRPVRDADAAAVLLAEEELA